MIVVNRKLRLLTSRNSGFVSFPVIQTVWTSSVVSCLPSIPNIKFSLLRKAATFGRRNHFSFTSFPAFFAFDGGGKEVSLYSAINLIQWVPYYDRQRFVLFPWENEPIYGKRLWERRKSPSEQHSHPTKYETFATGRIRSDDFGKDYQECSLEGKRFNLSQIHKWNLNYPGTRSWASLVHKLNSTSERF